MQRINWGVIGPGGIAETFAKAIANCKKAKILAVASRSSERAQRFADTFEIEQTYNNYAQMLANPDIDIVYIATPHNFHYHQVKLCLEAGKHVLVEKPCTVNATQMQQLVTLAKQKKLLLQEALWSRFMPALLQVRESIEKGIIGEVQYLQSDIGFAFQGQPKQRLQKAELAGGALLDLGVYSISLGQFLLQENPDQIQASAILSNEGVDTHLMANMRYPSGRLAQFSCSMSAETSNTMRIVGTKGFVLLPACFWDTDQARIYINNQLVQHIEIPHPVNGFEYQIEACMQLIETRQICSALMSHQDSIDVMQVMDTIRDQVGVIYPESVEAC